jgi:hypothetical protein
VKYGFIERHESEFTVKAMCSVLHVSRSGYYEWRARPECNRVVQAHYGCSTKKDRGT